MGFDEWVKDIVAAATNLLIAFLIFIFFVFVVGELYAMYFINNKLLLWAPVGLLVVVLIARAMKG